MSDDLDEIEKIAGGLLRQLSSGQRRTLRRKAMFRRLATARYLRADADDHGFWVGFTGRASSGRACAIAL